MSILSNVSTKLQKTEIEPKSAIFHMIYSWDLSCNGSRFRLMFVIGFFSLCFVTVACRLVMITSHVYTKSYESQLKHSFRKEIVDCNGHVLAISLPSSSLFANPSKVIDPEDSLNKLYRIIPDIDRIKLKNDLLSNKSFVWIKHDLTPETQAEISKLGLAGFGFEREQKRIYTLGSLFSHIIGYIGRDAHGLAGLEKKYEEFLTTTEHNASDKLELSIDARLQRILSEELDATIKKFSAKGGTAIVVNPKTGEILGLVSKPDFDPNYSKNASSAQLFNIASQGVYEVGSVFKILTLAIGLDNNSVSMHDAYDLTHFKIGKFSVNDYHPMPGWHSVGEIFLHSSNIGASQILLEVGKENFKKYVQNLGLLDQLQIELPERSTPLFPSDNRWNDFSLATMSFGYGISISPLHFIQAMIPVVNGGTLFPLTLLKRNKNISPIGKEVFKAETSVEMRKLMRLVVAQGTGKKAEAKGYFVGGKTGTANKSQGGTYAKNSRISSFCGILPAYDPEYLVYVMIDEPKGIAETYGFATAGWTAAPTVGKIFARLVALYGIEAIEESDPEVEKILKIDYKIDQAV